MINNKILALKYRPQEFKDLIGQEVMAETITTAIKLGKTPNAYLLTGIRGVGKTTTARLIAKALNCEKSDKSSTNCSSDKPCSSCKEIMQSNHVDVLEMDAASKTGIDDVRELIENSKYSPTSAKFKIFIIDEVHMLSKQAFNGLLKTLEEPPSRLKFILATTEVRKIPVTILSRVQRFDLKRVNLEKMLSHLQSVSKKESGKISLDALRLISQASEGSVRDAISLLDRALISQNINTGKEIQDYDVRKMLGLADRNKLIFLFKEVLSGEQKKATKMLKEMIDSGLDAKNFLNDFLEIIYLFSRRISLGPIEKDITISESELKLIDEYSKKIDIQDIGLFWQLTIKTIDDLKILSNENLALEMYITQLIHLKKITTDKIEESDPIEKDQNKIKNNYKLEEKKILTSTKDQLKNTEQFKTNLLKDPKVKNQIPENNQIKSFEDLLNVAKKEKEAELKYDLERNVKLVSFNQGKIEIGFNDKLNKNFIKKLSEKLLLWTGERWIISLSKNEGSQTIYEGKMKKKAEDLLEAKKTEIAKKVSVSFPDAKLLEIKEEND
ncbi:MAG: DNA polymerase III, subunit gamma and tau [Rickettsiales bacterium]|nr:DNA polymerase III, subunit gamma and tau [Rickettsiales bacterium]